MFELKSQIQTQCWKSNWMPEAVLAWSHFLKGIWGRNIIVQMSWKKCWLFVLFDFSKNRKQQHCLSSLQKVKFGWQPVSLAVKINKSKYSITIQPGKKSGRKKKSENSEKKVSREKEVTKWIISEQITLLKLFIMLIYWSVKRIYEQSRDHRTHKPMY